MRRSLGLAIVASLVVAAAGCSNDNSTTTPSAPAPAPGTETFTATMAPRGTAIHEFTASGTGAVSVTLSATNPPSMVVGLGIGIPGANIGGCDLTKTTPALAGATAQLTATVEAGVYCAGAFDLGTVPPSGVVVTISVAHP